MDFCVAQAKCLERALNDADEKMKGCRSVHFICQVDRIVSKCVGGSKLITYSKRILKTNEIPRLCSKIALTFDLRPPHSSDDSH